MKLTLSLERGAEGEIVKRGYKAHLDKDGYLIVFYCDVTSHELRVGAAHKLIAQWFYRKAIPKGMTVHHRDEDKSNNHIDNLLFPLTGSEHGKLHARGKRSVKTGRFEIQS